MRAPSDVVVASTGVVPSKHDGVAGGAVVVVVVGCAVVVVVDGGAVVVVVAGGAVVEVVGAAVVVVVAGGDVVEVVHGFRHRVAAADAGVASLIAARTPTMRPPAIRARCTSRRSTTKSFQVVASPAYKNVRHVLANS